MKRTVVRPLGVIACLVPTLAAASGLEGYGGLFFLMAAGAMVPPALVCALIGVFVPNVGLARSLLILALIIATLVAFMASSNQLAAFATLAGIGAVLHLCFFHVIRFLRRAHRGETGA